jgi:hypothetical protein
MKRNRRLQSIVLVAALLALPFPIVASAFSCAPQGCSMACCARGHLMANGMGMDCANMHRVACLCVVSSQSLPAPNFALLGLLPPTQLSAAARLPLPRFSPSSLVDFRFTASEGFRFPPFQPPRS